jgi:mono/diheme cytochrome c family protein
MPMSSGAPPWVFSNLFDVPFVLEKNSFRQPNQSPTDMKPTFVLIATALGLFTGSTIAADKKVDTSKLPPASSQKGVTYAKDIKPLFEASCFKCHGSEKQKGKLRLDSLEAVLKGGEEGKILKAGDSANSGVIHAIARLDEDSAMPPAEKGKPLTAEQVGLVRAWIDQGAK